MKSFRYFVLKLIDLFLFQLEANVSSLSKHTLNKQSSGNSLMIQDKYTIFAF